MIRKWELKPGKLQKLVSKMRAREFQIKEMSALNSATYIICQKDHRYSGSKLKVKFHSAFLGSAFSNFGRLTSDHNIKMLLFLVQPFPFLLVLKEYRNKQNHTVDVAHGLREL